jgi:hypothetical protein
MLKTIRRAGAKASTKPEMIGLPGAGPNQSEVFVRPSDIAAIEVEPESFTDAGVKVFLPGGHTRHIPGMTLEAFLRATGYELHEVETEDDNADS